MKVTLSEDEIVQVLREHITKRVCSADWKITIYTGTGESKHEAWSISVEAEEMKRADD